MPYYKWDCFPYQSRVVVRVKEFVRVKAIVRVKVIPYTLGFPMSESKLYWTFSCTESVRQQNVFHSLGASRSVWEDVECKLRSVNVRRVWDPGRAFRPALGVTGISDDCYSSMMGVIVISLGTHQSARENFGCTWECRWTNTGITINLWEMPEFSWIFIQRTAGVIWDSPHVHERSISLNGEYDAWIIVHYHFCILPTIIFFNIVFFTPPH